MTINWEKLPSGEHPLSLKGAVGGIEAILHIPQTEPLKKPVRAVVICCHPHPQFGGTMTNKVVHTLAKTFSNLGVPALRFNFRGIGQSAGNYDDGRGERDDLLILCELMLNSWPGCQLWLAGFSFGSWISAGCAEASGAQQLLSIAPPVSYFDFEDFQSPTCPWLVVMGEQDDVVDPKAVFDWVDTQNNNVQLIKFPETGHFFHGQIVKLSNVIRQYYQPLINEL